MCMCFIDLRANVATVTRATEVEERSPVATRVPGRSDIVASVIGDDQLATSIVDVAVEAGVVVDNVVEVSRLSVAGVGEFTAAHVRGGQVRAAVVDLAVPVDLSGTAAERAASITEERSRVVADVAVDAPQPPVTVLELVTDLHFVLVTTISGQGREGDTGVDVGISLDPTGLVTVPSTNVVTAGRVAVGGVEGEQVRVGDLIRVVDPSGLDSLLEAVVVVDDSSLDQREVTRGLDESLEERDGSLAAVVGDTLSRASIPMLAGVAIILSDGAGAVVLGAGQLLVGKDLAGAAEDRDGTSRSLVSEVLGDELKSVEDLVDAALDVGRRVGWWAGNISLRLRDNPVNDLALGSDGGLDNLQLAVAGGSSISS